MDFTHGETDGETRERRHFLHFIKVPFVPSTRGSRHKNMQCAGTLTTYSDRLPWTYRDNTIEYMTVCRQARPVDHEPPAKVQLRSYAAFIVSWTAR